MVRISDARMSGTAFGTIILHVSPEAGIGGPLAAVENGDRVRFSVSEKSIELLVDDETIEKRLKNKVRVKTPARGYRALYSKTVLQAPDGCDFDFLCHASAESK